MQGGAWLFFLLFAVVIIGTYLSIRREWVAPNITAGVSVVLSIVLMILMSLAQSNPLYQAVIVGILVGGLFSGATLAVAWYFHGGELRSRQANSETSES
jgi:hypothetical protein